MSTDLRRRIRAAIREASRTGTSADLLARLCADGTIAAELRLTDADGARLAWAMVARRGKVAES